VAVAALRAKGLRQVAVDDETVALRLLVDRRDELGRARTDPPQTLVNRIHKLLLQLLPGGAKTFLRADQARALLATIRPRDLVGRTRRRLACELIAELVGIDKKIKAAKKELTDLVKASGSSLQDLGRHRPVRGRPPDRRHR
jgi:transposase